jgi:hypothetical protein
MDTSIVTDLEAERDALRAENEKVWALFEAAGVDNNKLHAEVVRLQIKLKRYEPVSHYNGLSIEEWKQRADKAKAALAEEEE